MGERPLGAAATPSDHSNYSRSPDFADALARSEYQRVNLNAPAISQGDAQSRSCWSAAA
jgi:hypothetical protein